MSNEGTTLLQGVNPDYQGAAQAFARAIEKNPNHALAVIRRGLAYYRLGEYRKAISDYDRAIELKRYQADAYYSRGDAYRELGDYQQAIADYAASIEGEVGGHLSYGRERKCICRLAMSGARLRIIPPLSSARAARPHIISGDEPICGYMIMNSRLTISTRGLRLSRSLRRRTLAAPKPMHA